MRDQNHKRAERHYLRELTRIHEQLVRLADGDAPVTRMVRADVLAAATEADAARRHIVVENPDLPIDGRWPA